MQRLDLMEEENLVIAAQILDQERALELHHRYGRYVQVEFPSPLHPHSYRLRAGSYVGQAPLAGGGQLHLGAKVPLANLFGMLEYAYQFKGLKWWDRLTSCAHLGEVYEYLAALLARNALDLAAKGLYQAYVEVEGDLPYVRGRILAAGKQPPRLQCRYARQTTDLLDNRIVLWTLWKALGWSWQRQQTRRLVRRAFAAWGGSTGLAPVSLGQCADRLYHRLNADYQPLHALCRFFLEHSSPALGRGEHSLNAFMIYMPGLFEAFVAQWLKIHLGGQFQVDLQYRVELAGNRRLAFRMDALIGQAPTGRVLAVLDTKYKRDPEPLEADIQQVVAYAVQVQSKKALLVYPWPQGSAALIRVGDIEVHALAFDLGSDLDGAGRAFNKALQNCLDKG